MTFTFKHDQDTAMMNQHIQHLGQKLFSLNYYLC